MTNPNESGSAQGQHEGIQTRRSHGLPISDPAGINHPIATYFVSDQMIYRFHYHPLAHSNQWFWKRDMSDEDLDRLAHQHSKKFALLASVIISVICIPGFGYLSYLGLTGAFN